jgi:hypothetical protein
MFIQVMTMVINVIGALFVWVLGVNLGGITFGTIFGTLIALTFLYSFVMLLIGATPTIGVAQEVSRARADKKSKDFQNKKIASIEERTAAYKGLTKAIREKK